MEAQECGITVRMRRLHSYRQPEELHHSALFTHTGHESRSQRPEQQWLPLPSRESTVAAVGALNHGAGGDSGAAVCSGTCPRQAAATREAAFYVCARRHLHRHHSVASSARLTRSASAPTSFTSSVRFPTCSVSFFFFPSLFLRVLGCLYGAAQEEPLRFH